MKLLEAEVTEYTTPTVEPNRGWQPITVKIENTDKNNRIIGRQLAKQITVYEEKDQLNDKITIGSDEWLAQEHLSYKFVIDSDEWLLEGCWFPNVNYDNSYIEIIVRFDKATEKQC